MAVARKYQFDVSFDHVAAAPEPGDAAPVEAEPVPAPMPEPEPSFSAADIETARQLARQDGIAEGEAAARASIEQRAALAAERLAEAIGALVGDERRLRETLQRQSAEIVLALIRTLVPALVGRAGTGEIELLLQDVFGTALPESRVVVRCAPALAGPVEALARNAAGRTGFDGALGVIGDARLDGDECRVEWGEGGVERSARTITETIETAVQRSIAEFDRRLGTGAKPPEPATEEAA